MDNIDNTSNYNYSEETNNNMESSQEVAIIDTPATTISPEESEEINNIITDAFFTLHNICNQFHINYSNASDDQKERWQKLISDSDLSSHMMVVCQKS